MSSVEIINKYYALAQWERKPSGTILMGEHEIAHTMQCCHCGGHFISRKGSGVTRGFCMRCYQVTCGQKECDPCIPFEEKIRLMEE